MKLIHLIPLGLFILISIALGVGLTLSPRTIPSALVGKHLPNFDIPPLLEGGENVYTSTFKNGKVQLINIFASWCVPCRVEHPILMALKERGVAIYGLNYKDTENEGRVFLNELGNPFLEIGVDLDGRVGIDLGLSGVPETFVISGDGVILFQHIGPLTPEIVEKTILPYLDGGAE
jgi:cytochrome c biogenesis protein CcmG, thiol:disulfide interchange protein DsbE